MCMFIYVYIIYNKYRMGIWEELGEGGIEMMQVQCTHVWNPQKYKKNLNGEHSFPYCLLKLP